LLVPMLSEGLIHHSLTLRPNLFFGGSSHFSGEAPQQPVLDVRMQVSLKLTPVSVLASDNQAIECPSFECQFEQIRDVFEVMQRFIIHAAFGMAGIVTRKPVAAAAPRQRPKKRLLLLDFIEMQIEKAGPVAVHKRHP
jgi:hypothetical protein